MTILFILPGGSKRKKGGIWSFLRLHDGKPTFKAFKIEKVSIMLQQLFLSEVNANSIEMMKSSTN